MNSATFERPIPDRLHYLDVLRGFAAFCIVVYHWQHFTFHGVHPTNFDHRLLPFYALLSPLYEQGNRAVQLFFCLSGFIFFWLYAKPIAQREVGLAKFAWLRFSRLYPLHFVTLILVLVGQFYFKSNYGHFFVYPFNDAYHFVLQLFFMSHWGFQQGQSFNAPIWSVSIEVLIYIFFALFCFAGLIRWWQLLFIVLLTLLLAKIENPNVQAILFAATAFFCGGLSFKLYLYAHKRKFLWNKTGLWIVFFICLTTWACAPFIANNPLPPLFYRVTGKLTLFGNNVLIYLLLQISQHFYEIVVFPLTIFFLAVVESYKTTFITKLSFVGELTYSSYLLHFPLQLTFYSLSKHYHLNASVFYSPVVFIAFFSVLVPLSFLSYRYFEHPTQILLRRAVATTKPRRAQ